MKKTLALILTIILCFAFSVAINATESETVVAEVTDTVTAETEATEDTDVTEIETQASEQTEITVNDEKYAQQFIDYVFSGAQGSTELIDKIIAMGEQFAEQKEAGYTFKERINQLITPDNMITTVSAAFLLVCGIALFIFKRWQKRSNIALHKDVTYLREKYDEEALENKKLKEEVIAQSNEIKELKELITSLCERSDLRKTDMDHVSHTATAVAKMVKDVFLNSKTIDASGKALLVHNYMEAIGGEESEKDEQSS